MEDEEWEVLSWVKRGSNRKDILSYMLEVGEPRTATEISSKTSISRPHVSRVLGDMRQEERSLVERINPEAQYDVRYRLTDRGRKIAEKIKQIEEE